MPTVVLPGNYDGVHLGHQQLIRKGLALAGEGGRVRVLTFSPHPTHYFKKNPVKRIMTDEQKDSYLKHYGVADVVVLDFDAELSSMSPDWFVQKVLHQRLGTDLVVVGENFRFGANQSGDVEALRRLGATFGMAVEGVAALILDGEIVSSSGVRKRIVDGELAAARRLLGHAFELRAPVIRGDGRGRTIGVPTANLFLSEAQLLPPKGVYAVRVKHGGQRYRGVANIGERPTFNAGFSCEVHLLDVSVVLLGEMLDVEWVEPLRGEQRFGSPEALVAQIRKDIEQARAVLDSSA